MPVGLFRTSRVFGNRFNTRSAAFTLVELLVVIGIIALLISILLPALSKAREAARRVSCGSKIHEQLLAAQLHAMEHQGYYPLIGVLPTVQSSNITTGLGPTDFDDPYSVKYSYYGYAFANEDQEIAPITAALAHEMSYRNALDFRSNDLEEAYLSDDGGFLKHFLCPSHVSSISDMGTPYGNLWPLLYIGVDPSTSFGSRNQ
jgi:prepilin-type N-terminal cleavage/methylation domain-containing protein